MSSEYFKPLKHPVQPIHEVFKRYCLNRWKAEGIEIPTRYQWTNYDS